MSGADDILQARHLLRAQHAAALATRSEKLAGHPFATGVDYLADHAGRPVFLISALAEHTRNIAADRRVSLLAQGADSGIQASPRLTVAGVAGGVAPDVAQRLKARYLRYFPEAAAYFELDFHFCRIEPQHLRWVGGFGAARWIAPGDFLAPDAGWAETEAELVQSFRHRQAELIGIDGDGCDLRMDGRIRRLEFPAPLDSPAQAAAALAEAAARLIP